MATTYSALTQNLIDYTENDSADFAAKTDSFISQTEEEIYRRIDANKFWAYASAYLAEGTSLFQKPLDIVVPRYLLVKEAPEGVSSSLYDDYPVFKKDTSFIRTYWPKSSDTAFPALYYADWDDDTFIIAPTPDRRVKLTLGYTYRPAGLSSSNESSYISTNFPDALLYGALFRAYLFMKNMEEAQIWQNLYNQMLQQIGSERETRTRYEEARHHELRGDKIYG